jgi:hypothetical protein
MVKEALMGLSAMCVLFAPSARAAGASSASTPYMGTIAIPGTVNASNFDDGGEGVAYHDTTPGNTGMAYRTTDVDLEYSSDGKTNVGWIAAGEWLNYSVNVAAAGSYLLEARVASAGQGGTFHVEFGGANVTGSLTIPDTGGWQTWTTISKQVTLPAGAQFMRVVFDTSVSNAVGNLLWIRFTGPSSTPYTGTPITLPGTFHAETFDDGGEGVGYHDTTAGNSGGQFRTSDVDIETSSLGGYDVGWIDDGEWLRYSVNVMSAGSYTLQFRVASPFSTGRMHVAVGSVTSDPIVIPNTGDWQNWTLVKVNATLSAGPQAMTLVFDTGGFNVADISVTPAASTPFTGTAIALPGVFHAEAFDNGGEGIAYHDTSMGNSGGQFRTTDVDIEASSLGGYDVGWIDDGEWLRYSVNVASAATYTLQFRVASPYSSGRMHAIIGGVTTDPILIPNTGGWQNWTQVSVKVALAAGPQTMTLVFDAGNFNVADITAALAGSTPYTGTAIALPGAFHAEAFDNGGEGVAYHDTTAGNSGGQFRTTDVDIEASSLGGYDVGWIGDGEWLRYSVNVATAGAYKLQFRVASPYATGRMHTVIGGVSSDTIAIPQTGDWQNWTVVTVNMTLSAGQQILTLLFDAGGFNVADIMASANQQVGTGGAPTSYEATTDRIVRTKPPLPTLGAAGYKFADPAFGSALLRVTDANTRPTSPGVSFRTPSAGPQAAWNADSTRFWTTSTDGAILPWSFDAASMTASRIPGPGDGGLQLVFYVEPQFSSINPNLIYGVPTGGNMRTVTSFDFTTGSYTPLLDLDTLVPGLSGYSGSLMTAGAPTENLMVIFGGAGQDLHHYALWSPLNNFGAKKLVDTLASTINGVPTNITLNFKLHAATIDRSGRYIYLHPTGVDLAAPRYASPAYIWDTTTDLIVALTTGGVDGGTNTLSGGHGAAGWGYDVNHDCCTYSSWDAAQWQIRSLSSPLVTADMISPVLTPQEIYLSDHDTWMNSSAANPLVPIISATFRYYINMVPWRAWDDEIIAIETAAQPATVWRFAHHRSNVANDANAAAEYFWYEPRPSVSPNGQWVIFTSNWEKTLGTDTRDGGTARQDVFLLKLQ